MNDKLAKRIRALATQASPPGEPRVAYTVPVSATIGHIVQNADPSKPPHIFRGKQLRLAPCWRNRYLRMKKLNSPKPQGK